MSHIGKLILAGIVYVDANGQVVEKIERFGTITRIDDEGIFFEQGNGEEFSLPPDISSLKAAPEGIYTLKTTGEKVENPDLISTWTVAAPE